MSSGRYIEGFARHSGVGPGLPPPHSPGFADWEGPRDYPDDGRAWHDASFRGRKDFVPAPSQTSGRRWYSLPGEVCEVLEFSRKTALRRLGGECSECGKRHPPQILDRIMVWSGSMIPEHSPGECDDNGVPLSSPRGEWRVAEIGHAIDPRPKCPEENEERTTPWREAHVTGANGADTLSTRATADNRSPQMREALAFKNSKTGQVYSPRAESRRKGDVRGYEPGTFTSGMRRWRLVPFTPEIRRWQAVPLGPEFVPLAPGYSDEWWDPATGEFMVPPAHVWVRDN